MTETTREKTPSGSAARRPRRRASSPRRKSAGKTGAAAAPGPKNGVERARAAIGKAGAASRKTINRLLKEWRRMDTTRRLQFAAALLGALAAASAPIVRRRLKK